MEFNSVENLFEKNSGVLFYLVCEIPKKMSFSLGDLRNCF